jgi:hypothetical protein
MDGHTSITKVWVLGFQCWKYAHACLSSLPWWDNLKRIVESVQPLYAFLRFTEQERILNFSKVLFRYHILRQKMKIVQPTKNLMIAAQELLVMMVTMEMTLVVVLPHLPHKEEVMSDLSLTSRSTSSHTASKMKTTTSQHHQKF